MKGALVTVLAMCACVHAGVYYEAEENRQGPRGKVGLVIKRTCYVSGAKARIENTTPFGSDVVILRFDTGMRYNLRPRHKDCMSQELPKPDPRVRVTVTKTEESKKIGRYTCTRYDATVDGRTIRYWMTTEVKLGEEGATFWRSLPPLAADQTGGGDGQVRCLSHPRRDLLPARDCRHNYHDGQEAGRP